MSLNINTTDLQLLIYKRLLFELETLNKNMHDTIDSKLEQIKYLNATLTKIKHNFYIIANNLYPLTV